MDFGVGDCFNVRGGAGGEVDVEDFDAGAGSGVVGDEETGVGGGEGGGAEA